MTTTDDRSSATAPAHNWRDFSLVWAGQTVSLMGSEITTFGLGVWVFRQTGSVTKLALIYAFAAIPGLVLAPVAGVYIDRWSRRRALILTNLGGAVGPLAMVTLLSLDRLNLWSVYAIVAFATAFLTFQIPAFGATVTLMVPERHYGRASGMLQFGGAAASIVAPLVAGTLLPVIQLRGLIALDGVTFLIGVLTLLAARIPAPPPSAAAGGPPTPLLSQVAASVAYLRGRPGLLRLLAFFATGNLLICMGQVLQAPLVLTRGSAAQLGMVVSTGSCGLLAGSLLMSAWGGPSRRILGVLGFFPLLGVGVVLMGMAGSLTLIAVGLFTVLFVLPIINGCDQAIWQTQVPPDLQGRIFSTRQLIEGFTAPLAYLIAGPLADRVFEPLLRAGGPLATSAGRVLGVGPGRGIGLQFVVLGLLLIVSSLIGLASPVLRHLERPPARLPDDTAAAAVAVL
jgi:MFS transporter, DHA3 family, macrolide efflux protein